MKVLSLFVLLLAGLVPTWGDEITTLQAEIMAEAAIPVDPPAALDLATIMWNAHESTPYALAESESLPFSLNAVLKAIALSAPATEIVSESLTPLPWLQAAIPVDGTVSIEITPNELNFGGVQVTDVSVPEPSTILLLTTALILLGLMRWAQTSLRKYSAHLQSGQ